MLCRDLRKRGYGRVVVNPAVWHGYSYGARARFPEPAAADLAGANATFIEVRVTVTNWLGAADTSEAFGVDLVAGNPPKVSVVGGTARALYCVEINPFWKSAKLCV